MSQTTFYKYPAKKIGFDDPEQKTEYYSRLNGPQVDPETEERVRKSMQRMELIFGCLMRKNKHIKPFWWRSND